CIFDARWPDRASWPGGRTRVGVTTRRRSVALGRLVEPEGERVTGEGGALDAGRELDDAAQRLEVDELDLGVVAVLALAFEGVLVDRHHPLERPHEGAGLVDRLPL